LWGSQERKQRKVDERGPVPGVGALADALASRMVGFGRVWTGLTAKRCAYRYSVRHLGQKDMRDFPRGPVPGLGALADALASRMVEYKEWFSTF
jgi:hypothetical protein